MLLRLISLQLNIRVVHMYSGSHPLGYNHKLLKIAAIFPGWNKNFQGKFWSFNQLYSCWRSLIWKMLTFSLEIFDCEYLQITLLTKVIFWYHESGHFCINGGTIKLCYHKCITLSVQVKSLQIYRVSEVHLSNG